MFSQHLKYIYRLNFTQFKLFYLMKFLNLDHVLLQFFSFAPFMATIIHMFYLSMNHDASTEPTTTTTTTSWKIVVDLSLYKHILARASEIWGSSSKASIDSVIFIVIVVSNDEHRGTRS